MKLKTRCLSVLLAVLLTAIAALPPRAAAMECLHENMTETVLEAPGCETSGKSLFSCPDCGFSVELPTDPSGHDYGDWQAETPATWVAPGEETQVCGRCGDVKTRTLAQLTHLEAAQCPTGDADMDGKVTAADARLILRLAVKLDDGLDAAQKQKADFDGKDGVTALDARCALRVSVNLDPFKDPDPPTPTVPAGYTLKGYTTKGYPIAEKNGVTYIVTSYGCTLIANKTYALPADYTPYKFSGSEPTPDNIMGLTSECRTAFTELQSGAKKAGYSITLLSGYRSYARQKRIYNGYVESRGKAGADAISARPGHSEHQSGLALDVNSLSSSFGETATGKWLAANAWRYGFIIRYPYGKKSVTGYDYEPWHIRYLGKELAADVYKSGLTLEEYFGITSAY